MFCVRGKSRQLAKKSIDKQMAAGSGEISTEIQKAFAASQEEKQSIIDSFVRELFKSMKPRKCSQEFSTPEFAMECLNLMKKDPCNFSDLTLMKKIYKTEGVTHSKKTGKPLLKWAYL